MARQVLENGVVLPAEYSDDWYDDMTSNLTKLDDVIGSDSEKLSSADVGAAALSNNYNDLDNLPTIPTVNDATLTIQKNGVNVQTFTANASSNVTCNITVPTKTSDLTNDSNFVDTSNPAVASGITSAKVTDYDAHIADTDIHVTTADKSKWNNGVSQAYVFRYSSTTLVASSTNSNSLLDNTDNLKVGDKVIDSSGVLFSITSIDTANSTFTIGTALIDLAQDSDVVHTTGAETVGGAKTFSDTATFSSVNVDDIRWKNLTNQTVDLNDCYVAKVGVISGYYVASASTGTNVSNKPANTAFVMLSITTRRISASNYQIIQKYYCSDGEYSRTCSNGTWSNWIKDTDKFVTTDTAQTISGSKTFSSINGLEPGSLSLPDFSNAIDISSYITVTGGSTITNNYTPSADGYISVNLGRSSGAIGLIISNGKIEACVRENTFPDNHRECGGFIPVQKNDSVEITSCLADSVIWAYFIPVLGNV